ncbi:STY1053 family phage-associated protein [Cronobacter sakazakii]|uniref:STY1053 family phage-associated protein n=1 Tax=Cronobacter sakazakii TaxID=28141 RepID=UPI00289542AF|nr:hypothetical protein [Cronobacter sakazakii]MDT3544902.1 hypothetical protein [Cronobacter sakazakii]
MAKKTIRVHTPFDFQHEDGSIQQFSTGEHTVDDKVADHWFVVAHADVTGKTKSSSDGKELQAQIDSLNKQLADKDKTIGELLQSLTENASTIDDLNKQLASLQAPTEVNPAPEGDNNGKKQKSADSK